MKKFERFIKSLSFFDHFVISRFWEMLGDHLGVRTIKQLPLVTTFNRGYGDTVFLEGQV